MTGISLGALALMLAVLATYVWKARPAHPTNRAFATFTLALTGWVTGIAGVHSSFAPEISSRITFACASLMPATLLFFVRNYPTASMSSRSIAQRISTSLGVTFAILALTTPLVVHDVTIGPEGPNRSVGPLYRIFAAYFLIGCIVPLFVFLRRRRDARGQARARLQHLAAGLTILFAGGATANLLVPLLTGTSSYSWLGPYFVLPLVALVAHAIIRHRLLDLRLVIHRSVAVLFVMMSTAAVVIAVGRVWVPNWSVSPVFSPLDLAATAAACLLVLAQPVYKAISWLIDSYLYRGHTDHAEALQQATHRLSRLMAPAALAEELKGLTRMLLWPETFAMVVADADGSAFETLDAGNSAAVELLSSSLTEWANAMEDQQPGVLLVSSEEQRLPSALLQGFRSAGVEVVLFLARRQSLGLALLGPRRSGDAYFAKDLSFLESLAQLASVSLDNALLYRQRVQMLEYSARLLESLSSAVIAVDRSGKISRHNASASALFSLPVPAIGHRVDVLPSEVAAALEAALREAPHARETETVVEHPTRGSVPIILSSTIVRGDGSNAVGAIAVATDVSAVKALERNQRRLDHLSTMARFYAGIAHEIRSPLSSISNFAAMLSDRYDDPEFRDIAARLLPAEVGRIVRLADKLRLMAPSEDGKLAPVELTSLLRDIVTLHEPAAREHQISLALKCPPVLPRVAGDPGQLVQLFVNLINNAVEAMPAGGRIDIEADGPGGRDEIVTVSILDRGQGIGPGIQEKIFEPFFTTKPSGTGLGLSICQEISDFHGARLSLLPRAGGGTLAKVELVCLTDAYGRPDTSLAEQLQ